MRFGTNACASLNSCAVDSCDQDGKQTLEKKHVKHPSLYINGYSARKLFPFFCGNEILSRLTLVTTVKRKPTKCDWMRTQALGHGENGVGEKKKKRVFEQMRSKLINSLRYSGAFRR